MGINSGLLRPKCISHCVKVVLQNWRQHRILRKTHPVSFCDTAHEAISSARQPRDSYLVDCVAAFMDYVVWCGKYWRCGKY